MYRFLLTPRWLGILALTLAAAAVMVQLGNWQLHRYQERSAVNARIDAAGDRAPTPLREVLAAPVGAADAVGEPPPADAVWTRVTATGRYDESNVILVRGRTVNNRVGFEVVTPLVLADGSAVLVDRGWVPPAAGGALAHPELPAPTSGEVTVVGRVRLGESRAQEVTRRDGRLETRRIAIPELGRELPYPVYGGYLLLDEQDPPADPAFVAIPLRHENDWQNFGYVIQWWLFAAMALVGFGWVARREAHGTPVGKAARAAAPADRAADPAGSGLGPADRRSPG
ncbi:SURF1 family protein [Solwaraspora sp. WMMD1047]|uniref:SURF1 family cytochrome oxidase biogenesis protein n=1 Tax=Solwaraspora sp. WMMD1047 TaxID=3016102 RepID=UPI002417AAB6|nr:SURF1 family protein [Solwaraspora sp. WMMD1047]MDG4829094.1 SURF1 family protein [Solwaraspora sp. WMMD1047]